MGHIWKLLQGFGSIQLKAQKARKQHAYLVGRNLGAKETLACTVLDDVFRGWQRLTRTFKALFHKFLQMLDI